MSGMKDGFKRGTNYCYRMRMAGRAAAEQAAEHDMDRTVLMPGQEIGGEGCLHDVTSRSAGCDCDQFEIPIPAKGMR